MDRETLIRAILECNFAGFNSDIIDVAVKRIMECTEAKRVRHGKWLDADDGIDWTCSICGHDAWANTPFCPNCGARMDEVKDE